MRGPSPKPPTKRRRYDKPVSYGAAAPTVAPAASVQDRELGIEDPHPLITGLWDAVAVSCEAAYLSEADWGRLRLELWFADATMRSDRLSANAWQAVQAGLNAMLISPAEKRRCAIEVRPPDAAESDAVV